jgi:hypothetical protein
VTTRPDIKTLGAEVAEAFVVAGELHGCFRLFDRMSRLHTAAVEFAGLMQAYPQDQRISTMARAACAIELQARVIFN